MDEAAASLVNLSISTSGPQAPQCRIPFRAGWERNLELSSSEFTWGPKNQGGWCWCWVILLTIVQLFATPWTAAHQASLFLTISWSLLKLMFIESVMPSSHLILCHSLFPHALNFSQHQNLLQWISSSHQVAKVLELQSALVLPMSIQGWFPLGLTDLISPLSKGFSRVFFSFSSLLHSLKPSIL